MRGLPGEVNVGLAFVDEVQRQGLLVHRVLRVGVGGQVVWERGGGLGLFDVDLKHKLLLPHGCAWINILISFLA